MTQDHTTAAPVCYRHPDRHTLLACSRCGRPICGSCSIDASVGQRCPECVREEGTQEVIPTRRTRALAGNPATKTLLGVIVAFFVLSLAPETKVTLLASLAQINTEVAAGEWWRIFTPVFLHAGITHILFNMWAFWVLGPQVERGVGSWPFVALFFASAGVGGVFAFYLGNPGDVAVGASGAIFGLFGIWFSWALHRRSTAQGRAMLQQIGLLLLINALIGFSVPSVSWQAHLGGLVAGFVIGELWARIKGPNMERLRVLAVVGVAALAVFSVLI